LYIIYLSQEIVKTIETQALPTAYSDRETIDVHILRCTPRAPFGRGTVSRAVKQKEPKAH